MSITKKVITTNDDNQPKYQKLLLEKLRTWTGLNDPELSEALQDLCGDSFFEMRKMTAQICRAIESTKLSEDDTKNLVNDVKDLIDSTWRSIIDKQKVGVDKLGIIIKKHLNNSKDE